MSSTRVVPGEPHWFHRHHCWGAHIPSLAMRSWLFDEGSLTQRLKAICEDDFRVEVQQRVWQHVEMNECRVLQLRGAEFAYVREVILYCRQRPMVFARTVIPALTVQRHQYLLMLGNKPLGAALFADPKMHRGPIEITCLTQKQKLFRRVVTCISEKPDQVWGRRSLFRLRTDPLLVAEYFLPDGVPI